MTRQAFLVAFRHPEKCLSIALGGADETLAVRILANGLEQGSDCAGELCLARSTFLLRLVQSQNCRLGYACGSDVLVLSQRKGCGARTWPTEAMFVRDRRAQRGGRRPEAQFVDIVSGSVSQIWEVVGHLSGSSTR